MVAIDPAEWDRQRKAAQAKSEPPFEGIAARRHPAYKAWANMMQRCTNPKDPHWDRYGGRGIQVCRRWHNPLEFWADMGPTYQRGLTLDRIDNDGNYEPGNCRWTTWGVQQNNKRQPTRRKGKYD